MWREDLSMEMYEKAFSYADFFTPNEKEACRITGAATAREAIRILADCVACPIVKLGPDGCLFSDKGSVRHAPGLTEFVSVDSTGAGDAFLAGLMYGLFKGASLERCVRLANLVGGKCVTGVGCLTEYFDEEGLLAWEKRNPPVSARA
jgi:sugar/nucleoside kinase (ribokinase family)